MYNKGKWQHRFNDNLNEKIIAELWEKENEKGRDNLLEYLLANDPNSPKGEVTERDREVVATVIQWLGSPVGEFFLKEFERLKKREIE